MAEEELKTVLESLQRAIAAGDGAGVSSSLASLDLALETRRRELDPQLKHYLRNRSYEKALMFLNQQPDIPKGRCGGRTDFS